MFCQNKRLISAITKAGFTVEQIPNSNRFRAVNGDLIVAWTQQGEHAICVHCGNISDPRDSRFDHFPGYYAQTIRSAVRYLKGE